MGEKGTPVSDGFEYNSGTNPVVLDGAGLQALITLSEQTGY